MWQFKNVRQYTFKPTITIDSAYAVGDAFGPLITVPVPGNPAFLLRTQVVIAAPSSYTSNANLFACIFDRPLALAADKTPYVNTEESLVHRVAEFGVNTSVGSGRIFGVATGIPFQACVTTHPSARFFYVKFLANGAFTALPDTVVTVSFLVGA
jgi:hypothetical protein